MRDVEYVVRPEGELDIAAVPAFSEEWLTRWTARARLLRHRPGPVMLPRQQRPEPRSSRSASGSASTEAESYVSTPQPRMVKIFKKTGRLFLTSTPQLGAPRKEQTGNYDGHGEATVSQRCS